ncbi:TPA: hypothetical protein ACH3X3_004433 [Trebouxia sp. C0006]
MHKKNLSLWKRQSRGVACCLFQTTLADTADKPPHVKSTFKKASRHPASTTTLDSQKILCLLLVTSTRVRGPRFSPYRISCPKGDSYSCEGINPSKKAAASSGQTSGGPLGERPHAQGSKRAGSSAMQAAAKSAVKSAAKLKPAASVPSTLVATSPVLAPIVSLVSVLAAASAASGCQTPLPCAAASTKAGSRRPAQVPFSGLKGHSSLPLCQRKPLL